LGPGGSGPGFRGEKRNNGANLGRDPLVKGRLEKRVRTGRTGKGVAGGGRGGEGGGNQE